MLLALIAHELGLRSYPIIYQKVLRGHITSTTVQLDTLPPYYVLLVSCHSPYLALSSGACGASIRASVSEL